MKIKDVILGHYIPYSQLNKMIRQIKPPYNTADEICIMIDVYSIIKDIINVLDRYDKKDIKNCTFGLVTNILNISAHLRKFFNGINVNTKIYYYFSTNIPQKSVKSVPYYNLTMHNRLISNDEKITIFKDKILECMTLLHTICLTIPDIYFIQDFNHEACVQFQYLIHAENNYTNKILNLKQNTPIVIISKDAYAYQSVAINKGRVYLFRPYRNHLSKLNESYVIQYDNVLQSYSSFILKNLNQINITVKPELFSTIISLSGFSPRKIESTFHFSKVLKMLEIFNTETFYPDMDYILEKLNLFIGDILKTNNMKCKFEALDISRGVDYYKHHPLSRQILNESIQNINSRYIVDNLGVDVTGEDNIIDLMGLGIR